MLLSLFLGIDVVVPIELYDVGIDDFMPLVGHYVFGHNCDLFGVFLFHLKFWDTE